MFSSPISRWTGGTAAVCLGLAAVAYVGLVGPRRGEATELTASAAATQTQNDALEIQVAQLKAQFAKLPQKQAELATVLTQLPVDAAVPTVVRSLNALASASGVALDAVTPGAAQLLDAKGHPTPATLSAGAAGSGSGGPGQVVGVPLTLTVHGPYFKAVTFLKGVQSGQRAFLVTGLQVTVAGEDVTLTVRGRVFALPGAAAALAALPAADRPAAGSTPAPSATATP